MCVCVCVFVCVRVSNRLMVCGVFCLGIKNILSIRKNLMKQKIKLIRENGTVHMEFCFTIVL